MVYSDTDTVCAGYTISTPPPPPELNHETLLPSVVSILALRLGRWANTKQPLGNIVCSCGESVWYKPVNTTRHEVLVQCWTSVVDARTALNQHRVNLTSVIR